MGKRSFLAIVALLAPIGLGAGEPRAAATGVESVADSVCPLIEASAQAQRLPIAFLTRLIWRESSFEAGVTSPAGAEGIAQFMPGTAAERGVANPYDPAQAIPKAAELLAELRRDFGNLGLAAAAYNAGPTRISNWLAGAGPLPSETRNYVAIVSGHPVEDWTAAYAAARMDDYAIFPETACATEVAAIRAAAPLAAAASSLTAPWGVQIAGSFSKDAAIAAYRRARALYPGILGEIEPMVIGGRLESRGFSPFYRVRAPEATRAEAEALCDKLLRAGAACVVLRSS